MTQGEAYDKMLHGGYKVANVYYSPDEYVFINKDGLFETEDGYTHGGYFDEFWSVIQAKLPQDWKLYDTISEVEQIGVVGHGHSFACPEPYILTSRDELCYEIPYTNKHNEKPWYAQFDKKRKKRY
jgi:hypothetical protein